MVELPLSRCFPLIASYFVSKNLEGYGRLSDRPVLVFCIVISGLLTSVVREGCLFSRSRHAFLCPELDSSLGTGFALSFFIVSHFPLSRSCFAVLRNRGLRPLCRPCKAHSASSRPRSTPGTVFNDSFSTFSSLTSLFVFLVCPFPKFCWTPLRFPSLWDRFCHSFWAFFVLILCSPAHPPPPPLRVIGVSFSVVMQPLFLSTLFHLLSPPTRCSTLFPSSGPLIFSPQNLP